ncbi:MAG: hypothetical protein ACLQPD_02220 [Desulfomonilaceae bacterium]
MVYKLHTTNLRPDITQAGQTPITANIYSILMFASPSDCSGSSPTCDYFLGNNSMQWAAMYGGFNALSGCTPSTYPYPESNTSFNSATTPFCLSQCPPYAPLTAGSYKCSATGSLNKCCAEWNASKDPTRAGVPDNFSYASNGLALQTALSNIINNITQQLGSSSAVATVAQQNTEGALIFPRGFRG